MGYMHIGKDFVPPYVNGKVYGRIKYAEDYTREARGRGATCHRAIYVPGSGLPDATCRVPGIQE